MALTDQPYMPLYVNDLLTDEKLAECSAEAHGVYLRLLCILHKQEKYGLLCLKQKYKQIESKNVSKFSEFAYMLARQMPFEQKQISACLEELVREDVIQMQGDTICQKRMFRDGELSLIRAVSGKMGGSNVTKQYGKSGYLYMMSDFGTLIKIGISTNPKNRLYRLRCDMGIKNLTIIDTISVNDMGAAEDFAHDFFGEKMNGEWVTGSHDDVIKEFALLKAKLQANIKANTVYENEYNNDSSIVQVDACKNRETENVRGKPIPELAIAHIRGLGEIQIKTLPTENAWELTELREMITNSEHQFQSIASTKKPMNNVLNFQAILQSFVDMIQSSGQYQTSAELRKYFTNWIGKKNGTLEKFVEELKEDKPKTKNKNSFV